MELSNITGIFLVCFIFFILIFLDSSSLAVSVTSNENVFMESLGVTIFLSNVVSETGNWLFFTVLPVLILSVGVSGWGVSMLQSGENSFQHTLKNFSPSNLLVGLTLFVGAIEIFSGFLRPLTLNLRLIANVMGGHLIAELMSDMKMFKSLFFLAAYETFVCFMQALIFSILTFNYIKEMKSLL